MIIVSFEICLAPVEKSDSAILRNAMGHRRQKGTYIQTYRGGGMIWAEFHVFTAFTHLQTTTEQGRKYRPSFIMVLKPTGIDFLDFFNPNGEGVHIP